MEVIGQRYQVRGIRKGGMGEVFLCYDMKFRRLVALKCLQDRFAHNKNLVARFMWEAETWIRLGRHLNIVQAYYIEKVDARYFICLEFIEGNERFGSDLKGWIVRRGLDMPLSLNFSIQFCSGMEYACSVFQKMKRPFVYRDIKPSNIMVTADKIVKITDFGLVKLAHLEEASVLMAQEVKTDVTAGAGSNGKTDEASGRDLSLTQAGTILGTPPYMAPEQWKGVDIDHRLDIYAFGCVFYEMLTGNPPFKADLLDEMEEAHLYAVPKPIPYAPKKLNDIIAKCLEKDRNKRYQSFSIIKEELQSIYSVITGARLNLAMEGDALLAWELVNKGVSLYHLGYFEDAQENFGKAIELKPDYPEAYYNRSVVYFLRNDFAMALKDSDAAIRLKPDYAEAYYNRGNTYRTLGKIENALLDYGMAIHFKPDHAEAYYNRGNIYRSLGNVKDAVDDFSHAIALKSHSSLYLYTRGCTYHNHGQWKEAIEDYQEAIRHNPTFVQARYNLATCMEADGKYQEALDAWISYIHYAKDIPSQEGWVTAARGRVDRIRQNHNHPDNTA